MTGNQACRAAEVRLEIFSVAGALMHEQTFEGEVRDSLTTSCLGICAKQEGHTLFPESTSFESPGK